MLPKLIIHPDKKIQIKKIKSLLEENQMSSNHPDLLWIESEKNIGVEDTKKIKEHFLLKPHTAKGRVAVLIGAEKLTPDAQNSLLKILEEPPVEAQLIVGANSESALLSTVLSRCELIFLNEPPNLETLEKYQDQIRKAVESSLEDRFALVEKTDEKDQLLEALLIYYSRIIKQDPSKADTAKKILQAQEWQKSNVNIRTILEYLMLNL